jgi:hypothetical protein
VSQSYTRGAVAALALVFVAALPAAAQDDRHGVVGLGPSFLTWSDYSTRGTGVSVDLAHPFANQTSGPLRWAVDFGIFRDGDETDTLVLGGVRLSFPVGARVNIDVQGLLGVAHIESFGFGATAFSGGPGASVRFWLTDRLGVKGQFDYQIPNWELGSLYRTWIGLVFGLSPG